MTEAEASVRWSKRHGAQRSAHDHILHDRAERAADRDREKADAADEAVCTCGWIAARDACPLCKGVRVPESADA